MAVKKFITYELPTTLHDKQNKNAEYYFRPPTPSGNLSKQALKIDWVTAGNPAFTSV